MKDLTEIVGYKLLTMRLSLPSAETIMRLKDLNHLIILFYKDLRSEEVIRGLNRIRLFLTIDYNSLVESFNKILTNLNYWNWK